MSENKYVVKMKRHGMSGRCPIVQVNGHGLRITLNKDAVIMRQVRGEMRDVHVFARGTYHTCEEIRA
jgi:hypothetical protein